MSEKNLENFPEFEYLRPEIKELLKIVNSKIEIKEEYLTLFLEIKEDDRRQLFDKITKGFSKVVAVKLFLKKCGIETTGSSKKVVEKVVDNDEEHNRKRKEIKKQKDIVELKMFEVSEFEKHLVTYVSEIADLVKSQQSIIAVDPSQGVDLSVEKKDIEKKFEIIKKVTESKEELYKKHHFVEQAIKKEVDTQEERLKRILRKRTDRDFSDVGILFDNFVQDLKSYSIDKKSNKKFQDDMRVKLDSKQRSIKRKQKEKQFRKHLKNLDIFKKFYENKFQEINKMLKTLDITSGNKKGKKGGKAADEKKKNEIKIEIEKSEFFKSLKAHSKDLMKEKQNLIINFQNETQKFEKKIIELRKLIFNILDGKGGSENQEKTDYYNLFYNKKAIDVMHYNIQLLEKRINNEDIIKYLEIFYHYKLFFQNKTKDFENQYLKVEKDLKIFKNKHLQKHEQIIKESKIDYFYKKISCYKEFRSVIKVFGSRIEDVERDIFKLWKENESKKLSTNIQISSKYSSILEKEKAKVERIISRNIKKKKVPKKEEGGEDEKKEGEGGEEKKEGGEEKKEGEGEKEEGGEDEFEKESEFQKENKRLCEIYGAFLTPQEEEEPEIDIKKPKETIKLENEFEMINFNLYKFFQAKISDLNEEINKYFFYKKKFKKKFKDIYFQIIEGLQKVKKDKKNIRKKLVTKILISFTQVQNLLFDIEYETKNCVKEYQEIASFFKDQKRGKGEKKILNGIKVFKKLLKSIESYQELSEKIFETGIVISFLKTDKINKKKYLEFQKRNVKPIEICEKISKEVRELIASKFQNLYQKKKDIKEYRNQYKDICKNEDFLEKKIKDVKKKNLENQLNLKKIEEIIKEQIFTGDEETELLESKEDLNKKFEIFKLIKQKKTKYFEKVKMMKGKFLDMILLIQNDEPFEIIANEKQSYDSEMEIYSNLTSELSQMLRSFMKEKKKPVPQPQPEQEQEPEPEPAEIEPELNDENNGEVEPEKVEKPKEEKIDIEKEREITLFENYKKKLFSHLKEKIKLTEKQKKISSSLNEKRILKEKKVFFIDSFESNFSNLDVDLIEEDLISYIHPIEISLLEKTLSLKFIISAEDLNDIFDDSKVNKLFKDMENELIIKINRVDLLVKEKFKSVESCNKIITSEFSIEKSKFLCKIRKENFQKQLLTLKKLSVHFEKDLSEICKKIRRSSKNEKQKEKEYQNLRKILQEKQQEMQNQIIKLSFMLNQKLKAYNAKPKFDFMKEKEFIIDTTSPILKRTELFCKQFAVTHIPSNLKKMILKSEKEKKKKQFLFEPNFLHKKLKVMKRNGYLLYLIDPDDIITIEKNDDDPKNIKLSIFVEKVKKDDEKSALPIYNLYCNSNKDREQLYGLLVIMKQIQEENYIWSRILSNKEKGFRRSLTEIRGVVEKERNYKNSSSNSSGLFRSTEHFESTQSKSTEYEVQKEKIIGNQLSMNVIDFPFEEIKVWSATWNMEKLRNLPKSYKQMKEIIPFNEKYNLYALAIQDSNFLKAASLKKYFTDIFEKKHQQRSRSIKSLENIEKYKSIQKSVPVIIACESVSESVQIIIFSTQNSISKISNVDSCAIKLVKDKNKGCCSISLKYNESKFLFINAFWVNCKKIDIKEKHLKSTFQLKNGFKEVDFLNQFDYIFFMGDLNYVTDIQVKRLLKISNITSPLQLNMKVVKTILKDSDEFNRERKAKNDFLVDFIEPEITFLPNYPVLNTNKVKKEYKYFTEKIKNTEVYPCYRSRILYKCLYQNSPTYKLVCKKQKNKFIEEDVLRRISSIYYNVNRNFCSSKHLIVQSLFEVQTLRQFCILGLSSKGKIGIRITKINFNFIDENTLKGFNFKDPRLYIFSNFTEKNKFSLTNNHLKNKKKLRTLKWGEKEIPYINTGLTLEFLFFQKLIFALRDGKDEKSFKNYIGSGALFLEFPVKQAKGKTSYQFKIPLNNYLGKTVGYLDGDIYCSF